MKMSNTLSNIIMFIGGAAVGAGAAYVITKKRYEQIGNEEILSVKETYANRLEELQEKVKVLEDGISSENEDEPDQDEVSEEAMTNKTYDEIISGSEYISHSMKSDKQIQNEKGDDNMAKPYVITPEEFDEFGYDTISLTYYADGVLTDEFGGVIEKDDIDGMIGSDFADHFGEYEDDSVFIRNENYEIDYEILRDLRKYSEIE